MPDTQKPGGSENTSGGSTAPGHNTALTRNDTPFTGSQDGGTTLLLLSVWKTLFLTSC